MPVLYPFLTEAEKCYNSIDGKLTKLNLILDLRDNGGGGDSNSNILLKQLNKYLMCHTVHDITNASTGSNAEQFAVKLKQYDHVISYGDKTKGSLAYELKPNDFYTLPSSGYLAALPSKRDKELLPYESLGVIPDRTFDFDKNWISLIEAQIANKK